MLTRQYEAPSLLVDQSDPQRVYRSAVQMRTGECRFFRSADRGATWSPNLSVNRVLIDRSVGTWNGD